MYRLGLWNSNYCFLLNEVLQHLKLILKVISNQGIWHKAKLCKNKQWSSLPISEHCHSGICYIFTVRKWLSFFIFCNVNSSNIDRFLTDILFTNTNSTLITLHYLLCIKFLWCQKLSLASIQTETGFLINSYRDFWF